MKLKTIRYLKLKQPVTRNLPSHELVSKSEPQVIYQRDRNIALSKFNHIDDKIWIKAPFYSSFIVENPYTGDDNFIRKDKWNKHFSSPILKLYNSTKLFKNCILTAILWVPDHKIYTDRLVMKGHEFYRCFNSIDEDTKWIMIPLWQRMGAITTIDNPGIQIKDGNKTNLHQTLEIFHPDIYVALSHMFGNMINAFQMIFRNKERRWYIQFPRHPSYLLTKSDWWW
jgi:hypothetical protein